jgi:hypothetical protein
MAMSNGASTPTKIVQHLPLAFKLDWGIVSNSLIAIEIWFYGVQSCALIYYKIYYVKSIASNLNPLILLLEEVCTCRFLCQHRRKRHRRLKRSLKMTSPIKERITTDLEQMKEVGKHRSDRIREIVRQAMSELQSELKAGSGEVRSVVKDAFSGAIAALQGTSSEVKEEITASVEGIIDGISQQTQEKIAQTEAEIQRLQTELTRQEEALEAEVENGIAGIQEAGKNAPVAVQEQIEAAIATLQDSEEVALLKKRYAQLQAQVAILRANLAANSGTYYDRARLHLEDAKNWYGKVRPKAEEAKNQADQAFDQVQQKIGDAGTALAQRERTVRKRLSDLLYHAAEVVREGGHKSDQPIAQLPPAEDSSLKEEVKR